MFIIRIIDFEKFIAYFQEIMKIANKFIAYFEK